MKHEEFFKIKDHLKNGDKLIIRYFTFNKECFIDIYGHLEYIQLEHIHRKHNSFKIILSEYKVVNIHKNFNKNNIPNIYNRRISNNTILVDIDKILCIMDFKQYMRSFKLKQLIND